MKRAEIREVLSAYESWKSDLGGFKPDDFDFEETVDKIMEVVDHKKFK